ncbi:hypothetical protein Tco_1179448 [Tanacetum coccineum]
MVDENVPAPAHTRSDDQILPVAAWVPIGKSNYGVHGLSLGSNYLHSTIWSTLTYEAKSGVYSFELDETRFILDANLLSEALEITPIDQAHQFMSPPSGEDIMDFMNELGYTEVIHFVSRMAVNNLSQPWRAILSMINQWEFVQAVQTFLTDKANLGSPTKKGRKDKARVIPYCRFTKLIICHLGRTNNIHQRSTSPFHLAEDDLRLGNLKFVPKGEDDEVFGMPIPNELISNNIRNAPYYNAYLEMVAKHDQKVAAEKGGKKKTASTKQPKSKPAIEKSSKPAPAPKLKLVDEPDEEPAHSEPEPEPEHQGEGEDFDMERAIKMSLESFQGKAIVTEEQAAQTLLALHTPKRRSTTDQFILQRQTSATEEASTGPSSQPQDDMFANIVRDSPSSADAETGARSDKTNSGGDTEILQFTEELGEDVDKQENVEEKTMELDQDQAGSNPGETHESQPPPEQVLIDEDQA